MTSATKTMPLVELVERYIENPTRGPLQRDSATRLRRVASDFSKWLGCSATTKHFTKETVDQFINWRGEGISLSTLERMEKAVTMLWRFAAELGCCPSPFRPHSRRANRTTPSATTRAKPPRARPAKDSQLDRIEEMLAAIRRGGASQATQGEPAGQVSGNQPLSASSPLVDLLARYIDERSLIGSTQHFHRSTLRSFERYLNRAALVPDINEDAIEGFVSWRRQTSRPATCEQLRVTIRGWWRYAAELRLLEPPTATMSADQELAGCLLEIAARNAEAAKDQPSMSLNAAMELYFRERLTFGVESTKHQLRINMRRLGDFLGRAPQITDLTDEVVRESMAKMHEKGLEPRTVNKFRDNLLAIWRFLNQRQILATLPEVKPMNEPKRDPIAWSKEELAKLWTACEAQTGFIGEVPARLWWHALHSVAWNTGERITALLSVRRADVDLERGWILVRAEHRKAKRSDQTNKLHSDTCAVLKELLASHSDPLVFPWPFDPTYLWTRYGRLLEEAGLPNDRQHKFHCLRKSVASWFEAAGGNAQRQLGHADARVTQKYLDPRIVRTTHAADTLFQPGKLDPVASR